MEQYAFTNTLYRDDRSGLMFPPDLGDCRMILVRPMGEIETLSRVLAQLPSDRFGAELAEVLMSFESSAQDAKFRGDWDNVIFNYSEFRNYVMRKHKEKTLPPDAWVFLNLYAGIPMCDVFLLKSKNPKHASILLKNCLEFLVKKNPVKLPDRLTDAISFRINALIQFEIDRERFKNSLAEHADYLEGTLIDYIRTELRPSLEITADGPDPTVTIVRPWVSDMRVCASLHLMWLNEEQPQDALYWMQLCKELLKRVKAFCATIGSPLELGSEGTSLVGALARDFYVMEVRAECHEAECYLRMGQADKGLQILMSLKDEGYLSDGPWTESEVSRVSLMVEVYNKLLIAYSSVGRSHPDHSNLVVQSNLLRDEIFELQELIGDDQMRAEDYQIKKLKIKALWSTGPQKVENFGKCLQLIEPLLKRSDTLLPRDTYVKHKMECLLGLASSSGPYQPGLSGIAQQLLTCQRLEHALELAYEGGDISMIIESLNSLGNACLNVFLLKRESVGPPFVLNRDSGALPQFSGSWLTSEVGPLASVVWNPYHPLELQLFERLCSLQISKQAEVIYSANDRNDDWYQVLNQRLYKSAYINQQHACELMINGLIHDGNYSEREEPATSSTQIMELLRRRGCSVEQKSEICKLIWELHVRQFLASERGMTRTLVYQLGPGYLTPGTAHSLKHFDSNDELAWNTIQDGQLACGERSVCVEYSYDVLRTEEDESIGSIYIYVVTRPVSRGVEICRVDSRMVVDCVGMKSLLDQLHSDMSGLGSTAAEDDNEKSRKTDYNEAAVIVCLQLLYDLLIRPIVDLLPQFPEHNVIFAPQGVLANVPFGLLWDSDTEQFLFERHIISLAPSLRVLGFCKQRYLYLKGLRLVDDTTPVILVGNPAYADEKSRLDGTKGEMKAIADVFQKTPGRCVGILEGTDASVEAVLALAEEPSKTNRTQACIHFAVHGRVTEDHPKGALELTDRPSSTYIHDARGESTPVNNRSPWKKHDRGKDKIDEGMTESEIEALDLLNAAHASSSGSKNDIIAESTSTTRGGANTNETGVFCEVGGVSKKRAGDTTHMPRDKFLRSEDIIKCGVDWRVYVVVMSACNTARGQVLSEGVLNLPRAFVVAGVPCMVMSHWMIDDACTPMLMKEFYTHMKAGDYVASALRKAMLNMKDTGMAIYKWGPFAVWGFPIVRLPPQLVDRVYF